MTTSALVVAREQRRLARVTGESILQRLPYTDRLGVIGRAQHYLLLTCCLYQDAL